MNETLAKLKAIRERTKGLMDLHASPPKDLFENMRDQFFSEAEKLKIQFPILTDFKPENYKQFLNGEDSYYKWGTRALIQDIDYFLTFLNGIEENQLTNLKGRDN